MISKILTILVLAVVTGVYASLLRGPRRQPTTLRKLANSNPRFLL